MVVMSQKNSHMGQPKEKLFPRTLNVPQLQATGWNHTHLMDSCYLANKLWEKTSFRCQKYGRVKEDITKTIRNWAKNPYKSHMLNSLRRIILGLLIYTIWKERNWHIIKNRATAIEIIWGNLCNNLQETLALQTWHGDDFPSPPQEWMIWQNWNLRINQTQEHPSRSLPLHQTSSQWLPPPLRITQLNFDGASKGNLGKAEHGGIFKDHNGKHLMIFLGTIGWDTNNSV